MKDRVIYWVRISQFLGLAGISLFLAAAYTPLPELLAGWATIRPQIAPADAIVVLAGSVSPSGVLSDGSRRRTVHGIVLFQEGFAPLLVLSGGSAIETGPREAEVRAELARTMGVPSEAILTDSGAQTTREEAVRMQSLLRSRGVRTILLVTHAQHMLRAKGLFERAGFEILPAPVNGPERTLESEARLDLFRRTAGEMLAWLYYRFAGYL